MNHIDLFSGIGGFALAVDEVWNDAEHIFCEIDPYCQALLKKRFEGSVVYGDIRTLTADAYIRRQEKQELQTTGDKQCDRRIDLLTGGFPCQPFSHAGKRRGTEDNRYLWPEMLRVIQEFKPTWVIAENVRGILTIEGGLVFEQVCADLEGEGYEVQPFVIPAVAVNAPHRRDRVWIVAHCTSERPDIGECNRQERHIQNDERIAEKSESKRNGRKRGVGEVSSDVEHTSRRSISKLQAETELQQRSAYPDWSENWLEVATKFCGVDDGLPAELDGFKLTKAGHRVERLKALGNAIVPQAAIEIIRAIKFSVDD